jgi:hypothetical protein
VSTPLDPRGPHDGAMASSARSEPAVDPSPAPQLERDQRLDALCDVALGSLVPAVVFGLAARALDVPLAGPLTLAGLLLGILPVVGRLLWLLLVGLLCLLDSGAVPALQLVGLVVVVTVLSERALRRFVHRLSGGAQAHRLRVVLAVTGLAAAGLPGLVVALALSPRRRQARTSLRQRWQAGAVAGPILLVAAVLPSLALAPVTSTQPLPAKDAIGLPIAPQAAVLFVHGLGEAGGRSGDFDAVFGPLSQRFGKGVVHYAHYYPDLSDRVRDTRTCAPLGPTLDQPALPDDLGGMPIDLTSVDRTKCDSESDLGLDVLALVEQVRQLHGRTGQRVVLVGYSMGGAIVRGLLTLSAVRHDRLVADAVDAVVLVHAVTQGSVIARDGSRIAKIPLLGDAVTDLSVGSIADPSRPAFEGLAPRSAFNRWLAQHARTVPAVPTFVAYGDLRVTGETCVLAAYVCATTGVTELGDVVVRPGLPDPAAQPEAGGSRFLPEGRGPQSWEWPESIRIRWDRQLDPLSVQLGRRLYAASSQHFGILSESDSVVLADCQTGQPVRESDELRRVISGRLLGEPYVCVATPEAGP